MDCGVNVVKCRLSGLFHTAFLFVLSYVVKYRPTAKGKT